MNRLQANRVQQIVNDYLLGDEEEAERNRITREGKSISQMTVETGGLGFSASGKPFDPVVCGAQKLERLYLQTTGAKYAAIIMNALSEEDKQYLCAREFYRKRVCAEGNKYTVMRIANEIFGIGYEEYKYKLKLAKQIVLSLDEKAHQLAAARLTDAAA